MSSDFDKPGDGPLPRKPKRDEHIYIALACLVVIVVATIMILTGS